MGGMSASDIVLQYVIPSVGSVITVIMFLSSMPAVLRVRKENHLGELNVLPYPAIIANGCGWVGYSFVKPNGFILGPNAPGVLIGFFYMMTCMPVTTRRAADWMTVLIIAYSCVFIIVGAVTCYRDLSDHTKRLMWGYTCNTILITYYAAPLSTLVHVWRTRNAASLSLPLATTNAINGALWLAYGIAIHDNFVAVPNGIGLLLALVILFSIFVFWSSRGQLVVQSDTISSIDIGKPLSTDAEQRLAQMAHFRPEERKESAV